MGTVFIVIVVVLVLAVIGLVSLFRRRGRQPPDWSIRGRLDTGSSLLFLNGLFLNHILKVAPLLGALRLEAPLLGQTSDF